MKRLFILHLLAIMALYFSGCAGLQYGAMEPPVVSLQSFKVLPQDSITPRFEFGLSIVNPNSNSLQLEGLFYTVDVEGHRVLAGVANNLPEIAGYGEEVVLIEAGVDLLSGINLFSSLMRKPRESFKYTFTAVLDPGGFSPKIELTEDGEFNLSGNKN